jgi:hypothetical protein
MEGGTELRREGIRTLGVGPGVHLGIQTCGVITGAVKLDCVVQTPPVRVKGQIGQSREQQCARLAQMIFDARSKRTAEKDCAAWIDLEQRLSSFGQVDRLDEPSIQAAGLDDMGIEIGEALDVDQASSHDTNRRLLMMSAFCQEQPGLSRWNTMRALRVLNWWDVAA